MTREEAIADIRDNIKPVVGGKSLDIAIKALEQQKEWIPASERLPKAGEYIGDVAKYYLVQNEYGDMMVAHYAHSEYWEQMHQLGPIADDVVAWMPLPKPYVPDICVGEMPESLTVAESEVVDATN